MGLFDSIGKAVSNAVHTVEHGVGNAAHAVANVASSAASTVTHTAENTAQTAAGAAHGLFDRAGAAFSTVTHAAGTAVSGAEHAAASGMGALAHTAGNVVRDVTHTAGNVAQGVGHTATNVAHGVARTAGNVVHQTVKGVGNAVHGVTHAGQAIAQGVQRGVGNAVHGAEHLAGNVLHGAEQTVGRTTQGVQNLAGSAVHGAGQLASHALSGAQHAASGLARDAGQFVHGAGGAGQAAWRKAEQTAGNVWHSIANGTDNLYHQARHDLKQNVLIPLGNGLDKVGVGSLLDKTGLGKVSQDKIARNQKITRDYANVSRQMQDVLGPGAGANWATFAGFASSRAGQAIRNQDDPGGRTDRDLTALGSSLPLVGGMFKPYNNMYTNESNQASAGNSKVYNEIYPKFQDFVKTFKGLKQPDQQKWDQFAKGFSPDQHTLLDGFHNYYNSMFQTGKAKNESITLGNIQMGLHEQRRLQPQIQGAFPPGQSAQLTQTAQAQIGSHTYNLGQDVKGGIDPSLRNIDNPQLRSILQQYAPNVLHGSTQGSGARDWANLDERMRFIATLFASHYSDPSLYQSNPAA